MNTVTGTPLDVWFLNHITIFHYLFIFSKLKTSKNKDLWFSLSLVILGNALSWDCLFYLLEKGTANQYQKCR